MQSRMLVGLAITSGLFIGTAMLAPVAMSDGAPRTGPRDGDVPKTGPRDGETPRTGPRDGDVPKTGPGDTGAPSKEGDGNARKRVRRERGRKRGGGDGAPKTGPGDTGAPSKEGRREGPRETPG